MVGQLIKLRYASEQETLRESREVDMDVFIEKIIRRSPLDIAYMILLFIVALIVILPLHLGLFAPVLVYYFYLAYFLASMRKYQYEYIVAMVMQ